MEQVRYGIIGIGTQGSHYMHNLFDGGKIRDGVLVAACDINPAKIETAKEKIAAKEESVLRDLVYFTNYEEMLDSGLCDAVLVEVPHYDHPKMVMACLSRGIHAICEKPAGVYAKQVKEMNALAEKSNALFGMMFNQRTNCLYRKMREMIAEGKLGEIQRVTWVITNWYRSQAYYDNGAWRATWAGEGGGVLFNQSPHQLDLISWVVGMQPKTVNGFCQYGKWHDIEVEDDVTAYFEYENGATGTFITSTGQQPGTNRFEVVGTKGKLTCEATDWNNEHLYFTENDVDSVEFSKTNESSFGAPKTTTVELETDGSNEQHAGIINNFTAAILGKEKLFVAGTEGIKGVELMNAIQYSGWHGGMRVSLPVDEDAYLAKLDEFRAKSRLKENVVEKVADSSGSFGGAK